MRGPATLVEERLAAAAGLVAARHEAFLANPDDPETNHKLRVSIRTLRGLASFLQPWLKAKQRKRVQRTLKKTVRKTSRLRELDVLAGLAAKTRPDDAELVAFLEDQARRERARVVAGLSEEPVKEGLRNVSDDLGAPRWKRAFDAAEARSAFDDLVAGLQRDLDGIDEDDYELVHSVRKRAKQVRYVAEQFEPVLGDDVVDTARHMKAQQDHLGALCDARVNRDLVEGFLAREDLSPSLARSLAGLLEARP